MGATGATEADLAKKVVPPVGVFDEDAGVANGGLAVPGTLVADLDPTSLDVVDAFEDPEAPESGLPRGGAAADGFDEIGAAGTDLKTVSR